jgi:hypothetical protein
MLLPATLRDEPATFKVSMLKYYGPPYASMPQLPEGSRPGLMDGKESGFGGEAEKIFS